LHQDERLVYDSPYKAGRPPRQSFEFAPASVDGMKLDEACPHLRASAELFADAQADEIRLYLGDLAFDYWKPLSLPLMREVGFAQQNSEGENVSAQLKTTIPSVYETEYIPSVSYGCGILSSNLFSSAKGRRELERDLWRTSYIARSAYRQKVSMDCNGYYETEFYQKCTYLTLVGS